MTIFNAPYGLFIFLSSAIGNYVRKWQLMSVFNNKWEVLMKIKGMPASSVESTTPRSKRGKWGPGVHQIGSKTGIYFEYWSGLLLKVIHGAPSLLAGFPSVCMRTKGTTNLLHTRWFLLLCISTTEYQQDTFNSKPLHN